MLSKISAKIKLCGSLVRFSHSIFALPFALSMAVVISRWRSFGVGEVFWIVVAMVAARTAAMAFNRLVDRHIDAKNPRTQAREIPAGLMSAQNVLWLTLGSAALFLLSAAMLGRHCLFLAPFVLLVLLGYSYTKRFTSCSHLVLGLALGLAPGGVWYALMGGVAWLPVALMLAVLSWVAGFDVLYSCQDFSFDKKQGLFSVPAKFGMERAFQIAQGLHAFSLLCLLIFGLAAGLGTFYWLGLLMFSFFLVKQHRLVSPQDLAKIDQAFFVQNGLASVGFFAAVLLDRVFG